MTIQFTPAAERALNEAAHYGDCDESDGLRGPQLLLGLLAESECRAAAMLRDSGIDVALVKQRWPRLVPRSDVARMGRTRFASDVEASLAEAQSRLADYPRPLVLATEHLLLGLSAADTEVAHWLAEHGMSVDRLEAEIHALYGFRADPVGIEEAAGATAGLASSATPSTQLTAGQASSGTHSCGKAVLQEPPRTADSPVLRIIDAAANRAREGIRVVEDYARFVLDDAYLTAQLKTLRHDLTAALAHVPGRDRLAARDTLADVGTQATTPAEFVRTGAADVAAANFTRLAEALRSLEEYTKIASPAAAARLEALRYRVYTLERAVGITADSRERMADVRLYMLADGRSSTDEFERLIRALVEGGVDAIQLRDKSLDDRRLVERGRLLRELTRASPTLYIMNDRPDLAVLTRADGVHVGQEELTVRDVRKIVGTQMLIGVSTHSVAQARAAVLDGADYIGVGPTFASSTKQFDSLAGVDLLQAVAAEITLPAFGIGGISVDNLDQVLTAGITRVAVGSAIASAADPVIAARLVKETLRSVATGCTM